MVETTAMKPIFHPRLVNGPLGDPGLLVQFLYKKRALLFDLGDLSAVSNATLLKVSHVFVSHTHIDHFIGFDRLLRVCFGRGKTVHMYGPENFIANVKGKLAGFTWNLVDKYDESINIRVAEVHADKVLRARFRAIDKFEISEEEEGVLDENLLVDEPGFVVHTKILEHRVPCLGFALKEKVHINIRKEKLVEMDLLPGPWLNELKEAILLQKPGHHLLRVPVNGGDKDSYREIPLKDLKADLVLVSEGQKVAYVTDTVYNEENKKRIVDLVRQADLFFCESPFLAEETERARERCHLTSRQAGLIAREAGVKRLEIFHFSQRHTLATDQLYQEAEAAFKNGVAGD